MRGILFKPEMIKAIVEGRKTVTRRVMPNQPILMDKVYERDFRKDFGGRKPRYQVGEVVYIKEAWCESKFFLNRVYYKADDFNIVSKGDIWQSPLFMPERAARYFIKILSVRAERLQEISYDEDEAMKEGVGAFEDRVSYVAEFISLWDSLNKAYPWESNPWVFRYEFESLKG